MPRKQHTHKYIKRHTGGQPVWTCALLHCNHYMPPHLTPLVEGRTSICWECELPFRIDAEAMRAIDGKMYCQDCREVMQANRNNRSSLISRAEPTPQPVTEPVVEAEPEPRICIACRKNVTMNGGLATLCHGCFLNN